MINFSAADGQVWSPGETKAVLAGASAAASKYAEVINTQSRRAEQFAILSGDNYQYQETSSRDAFLAVHGGSVTFNKTGTQCASGCWGERTGLNTISVYTGASDGAGNDITTAFDGRTQGELWAVHELGHDFEASLANQQDVWGPARTALRNSDVPSQLGFAGGAPGWRQNGIVDFGEQFADSYLGWVYDRWQTNRGALTVEGNARRNFMNQNMSTWVNDLNN